jgi:hypothetical protein
VYRSTGIAIDLSPRAVGRVLLPIVFALVAASALAQVVRYRLEGRWMKAVNMFDANLEANVPTLFSTAALLCSCALAAAIAVSERGGQDSRRWSALAGLFALAAIDETVSLHEEVTEPLQPVASAGGLLPDAWVVAGAVLAVAIAAYFRPLVRRLPPPVRRLAITGAVLFAGGSLGLEGVQNMFAHRGDVLAEGLVGTVSELFEMVGVVLIIQALLLYIARERGSLSVTISADGRGPRG